MDAFITVASTKRLNSISLSAIAGAAEHSSQAVRATGMMRLSVLTHYFPSARRRMNEVLTHPSVEVRALATLMLTNTPTTHAVPAVIDQLGDAHWRVRKAAAEAAHVRTLHDTLSSLELQLNGERDARVRVVLSMAIQTIQATPRPKPPQPP